MPIQITMPALSPTMEAGTLARWLKKVGDAVKPGDVLAEIETDKATMEVEAVDEGTLAQIVVQDGTEDVKVGAVIGVIAAEGEGASPEPVALPAPAPSTAALSPSLVDGGGKASDIPPPPNGGGRSVAAEGAADGGSVAHEAPAPGGGEVAAATPTPTPDVKGYGANPAEDAAVARAEAAVERGTSTTPSTTPTARSASPVNGGGEARINASPLARRLAEMRGVALASLTGSGPNGRIVKADVDKAGSQPVLRQAPDERVETKVTPAATPALPVSPAHAEPVEAPTSQPPAPAAPAPTPDIPHETIKLSQMRKVIARRLTESKQTVPHYYLAIDCRLDALLKLRAELNAAQPVKVSVNDLLIKALAVALRHVPDANVSYTGDALLKFARADISVAVAIPAGLITPIVTGADTLGVATIATRMKDLAARAKDGKLQPGEYQGGTASLSNLGMYGIKQFEAVINPPQGMILAVGAGDRRPWVEGDALVAATVLTTTGSFDHRAIDGAVGAQLMAAVRDLVEKPLGLVV